MSENFSKVKISDIAERAGVSAGTVDRVIHNRGEVSAKTREKVLAIIREMDYQPDILASTLASKKNVRLAALLPEADSNNPFWQSPFEGLVSAWEEVRHFGVTLQPYTFTYHDEDSFCNQLEQIAQDPPAGLVIAPVFGASAAKFLNKPPFDIMPVVCLNTLADHLDQVSFVGQDPGSSGRVAAKLLDFGLDDQAGILIINIMSEKGGNSHILSREKGFREYFQQKGMKETERIKTIHVNFLEHKNLNLTEAFAFDEKGLQMSLCGNKGIFVTNSKVFHLAEYLEKCRFSNTKLVGYDLLEQNCNHLKKGTIDFLIGQKPFEQGYKSMMSLFQLIVMKKQLPEKQLLPIDIITEENIDFYLNQ